MENLCVILSLNFLYSNVNHLIQSMVDLRLVRLELNIAQSPHEDLTLVPWSWSPDWGRPHPHTHLQPPPLPTFNPHNHVTSDAATQPLFVLRTILAILACILARSLANGSGKAGVAIWQCNLDITLALADKLR